METTVVAAGAPYRTRPDVVRATPNVERVRFLQRTKELVASWAQPCLRVKAGGSVRPRNRRVLRSARGRRSGSLTVGIGLKRWLDTTSVA